MSGFLFGGEGRVSGTKSQYWHTLSPPSSLQLLSNPRVPSRVPGQTPCTIRVEGVLRSSNPEG